MTSAENEFQFVGGSMDGQKVRIGGALHPGMEYPGQLPRSAGRREIYILDRENMFRFDRYGLEFNPKAETPEALAELQPILDRVADVLRDLDSTFEKYGGPSAGNYGVGNWVLRHKDA
jgi:hypothetical protein